MLNNMKHLQLKLTFFFPEITHQVFFQFEHAGLPPVCMGTGGDGKQMMKHTLLVVQRVQEALLGLLFC